MSVKGKGTVSYVRVTYADPYKYRVKPDTATGYQGSTAQHTGYRTEIHTDESALVEITVDLDAILRKLGPRAALSKGGKASALGGKLVVKTLQRTEIRATHKPQKTAVEISPHYYEEVA